MAADLARPSHPYLVTLPGVYAPQGDTRLLMTALERESIRPGADVLDLGTGSGALALRAAELGGSVIAVDVARLAVVTARLNALLHHRRITVRRSDLISAVGEHSYDLVLCNPPYVPSPATRTPTRGASRAWDAGPDGRAIVDRVCDDAPAALRRGGVLLMVHSKLCDPDATVRRLSRGGLEASISARAHIPLGPVLLSRIKWLRERELISADDRYEELVVIRAEQV
ncbi:HemK2/MTQ2 family protein methyltransferase [Streptomyces sp. NBC_00893]|uniref:HemK2/MTQ2 family protein methyltransferase n=1 Tax=Streptomyces sp. NBC_00893 TaxID=2975862 RepID=UPI00224D3010|nr:HemK2/MTQ2 family protein methyltransferase [Streptomyces sp. NBC_00893]MCX4850939.1 methyltransferase [Streptomyces sp. NBC_00893]